MIKDDGSVEKYFGRETLGTYRPSGFNGPMNCRTESIFITGSAQCWIFKVSYTGMLSVDQYVNNGLIYPKDWCVLDKNGYCSSGGWHFNVTPLGIFVNFQLVAGGWYP